MQVTRDEVVQTADRQNVATVSVRRSKQDMERRRALAEGCGVGVGPYIRLLVPGHLPTTGAGAAPPPGASPRP